jgi:hypothetical protein
MIRSTMTVTAEVDNGNESNGVSWLDVSWSNAGGFSLYNLCSLQLNYYEKS